MKISYKNNVSTFYKAQSVHTLHSLPEENSLNKAVNIFLCHDCFLQVIEYVPELICFVLIWCHIEKPVTKNERLCYSDYIKWYIVGLYIVRLYSIFIDNKYTQKNIILHSVL